MYALTLTVCACFMQPPLSKEVSLTKNGSLCLSMDKAQEKPESKFRQHDGGFAAQKIVKDSHMTGMLMMLFLSLL
jgi:hypothetical protein